MTDDFAPGRFAKSAEALFSVELTRRWSADGIFSNALNPGAIATGLQKYTGGLRSPKVEARQRRGQPRHR